MGEKGKAFRWIVVLLMFFNIFVVYLSINCIPPLFREISNDISLTKFDMGLIMGVPFIAAILFSLIGGGISDRIGSKWALGSAIMLVAVFGILRSFSGSTYALSIHMFFIGAGMAILGPNIPKVIGTYFSSKQFATVNALCIIGMPLGGAVGMGISAGILSPALGGWRGVMVGLGLVAMVSGLLWMVFFKDSAIASIEKKEEQSMAENFKKVFRVKDIWWLGLYGFLAMAGTMALIALLANILSERGLTAARAGALVSIMLGVSTVFKIVGGVLSDRVGSRKPFLIIGALVQGICTIAFAAFSGMPLVVVLIICGIGMGVIPPIFFVIPLELKEIGPPLAATATGLIFMLSNAGGFFGPIISGKIMDLTGTHWPGFLFMGALLIIAAFCIFPMRETGRKARVKK